MSTNASINQLLDELYAYGREKGGMWNVGREGGALLAWFIRLLDARRVLEIGTSNGVSTIWMARALEHTGGELITLEVEGFKAEMADTNLKRASLREKVTLIEGPALVSLEAIGGEFDLVFIDAAKDQYPAYLAAIRDQVRSGGIIAADNVSSDNPNSEQYREAVLADTGLDHVELDIAGGFWVCRVL